MKLEVVVVPVSDVDREEIGQADPDWPDWYAQYVVDERTVQGAGA